MEVVKRRRRSQQFREKPARRRPIKLRQWGERSMTRALELVALGMMGVNRAALKCGVPATTLKDQVSGRVAHGSKMGPKPYLTYEEEELVTFLTNCSKMG